MKFAIQLTTLSLAVIMTYSAASTAGSKAPPSTTRAKQNEYTITFSNKSEDTYYLFSKHNTGADPMVLKPGEETKVVLGETDRLYMASSDGLKKLLTHQVYPIPGAVISEDEDGFNSQDLMANGKEILVTFEEDDVTMKNIGKPLFPPQ